MAASSCRLPALGVVSVFCLISAAVAQQATQPAQPAAPAGTPRRAAKPVVAEYGANVPPVMLSAQHGSWCRLLVGDEFPAIELPQLNAGATKLSAFAGSKSTVVLFWQPGHWMSRVALAEVAQIAAEARDSSVGVVGVIEGDPQTAQPELDKAGARFSQLVDTDGSGFALVGSVALPRVYVIDGNHRIAWFDIEFSEATRRELRQALATLAASN